VSAVVDPPSAGPAWLLGLLLAPALLALGFAVLPRLVVGEAAADAGAAAFTSMAAVAGLFVTGRGATTLGVRAVIGAVAAGALAAIAIASWVSVAAAVVGGGALVAIGWAVGDGIGRRIAHPGHLGPACAIAGGADLMSVLSPEGPSNAIAASDLAVSVLVVAGPVPGHAGAIAPTIGLGDLVFIALLLGAAAVHGIARTRVVVAVIVGVAASLVASATLRTAIPALPAIGLASVIAVGRFRRPPARERGVAQLGAVAGVALGLFAIVRAAVAVGGR